MSLNGNKLGDVSSSSNIIYLSKLDHFSNCIYFSLYGTNFSSHGLTGIWFNSL